MNTDLRAGTACALAMEIEERLVRLDRRGMGRVRNAWQAGYLETAVRSMLRHRARVLIVSGFPVGDTFETDGPAGALLLASALKRLGSEVAVLGAPGFLSQLGQAAALLNLEREVLGTRDKVAGGGDLASWMRTAAQEFRPTLVVFVEVPGVTSDGNHYNMRRENISGRTHRWEALLSLCACPTLAFADGGNELGMGAVGPALRQLDIEPAVSTTDQLVIADVSNWGVYGAVALASAYMDRDLFPELSLRRLLEALNFSGIVDGVTGAATPTEDGLPADHGESLIDELRQLIGTNSDALNSTEHHRIATPALTPESIS